MYQTIVLVILAYAVGIAVCFKYGCWMSKRFDGGVTKEAIRSIFQISCWSWLGVLFTAICNVCCLLEEKYVDHK